MTHRHFPMFIDSVGKRVLIIGGGNVAMRRIQSLLEFGFEITVIAETPAELIRELAEEDLLCLETRTCGPEDLQQIQPAADMILACTDDRDLNRKIGAYARERGIPVNVCDAREESTFWFPAIATNDELVMGLAGTGEDHRTVRKAAAALRKIIKERSY